MLGSVFSPYYARARRRGPADPLDHTALNVALYGAARRWTLTERRRHAVERAPDRLIIGPSSLAWEDGELVVRLDEIAVPLPRRVRGELRLRPAGIATGEFELDAAGRHRWGAIAPGARIDVDLELPRLRWSGAAYLDGNAGDVALEADFRSWHWSRTIGGASTTVLYDIERREQGPLALALRYDSAGGVTSLAAPPLADLARTRWGLRRAARSDPGAPARLQQTLEDTPFYARSVVGHQLGGEGLVSMHESLSLARFERPWVQAMIPFRMPRSPW
jgi:carotenoid 1,2-hydratase